jgi:hypothetical protein
MSSRSLSGLALEGTAPTDNFFANGRVGLGSLVPTKHTAEAEAKDSAAQQQ